MTDQHDDDLRPLDEADAAWLIERAALLDAMEGARTNVGRLREAAREAGISPAAFERALLEVRQRQMPTRKATGSVSAITRRIFTNFLPGWLITLIVPPLFMKPSTFLEIGPIQIGLLTIAAASVVTGHALASLLIGQRLRLDDRIANRISFFAGALAPIGFVALQITRVLRSPMSHDTVALVWAGLGAALTLAGFGIAKLTTLMRDAKRDAQNAGSSKTTDRDGPWLRFVVLAKTHERLTQRWA